MNSPQYRTAASFRYGYSSLLCLGRAREMAQKAACIVWLLIVHAGSKLPKRLIYMWEFGTCFCYSALVLLNKHASGAPMCVARSDAASCLGEIASNF